MRARRGSLPVAPWQRQQIADAAKRRIMTAARALDRASRRPGSGLHGGYLRETGLSVLWHILNRGRGTAGAYDPSLGQLAEWTGLARSTVQLAIKRLEAAGILSHVMRSIRVRGEHRQATNAYVFAEIALWMPDTDLRAPLESYIKKKLEKLREKVEEAASAIEIIPQTIPDDLRHALAQKWGLR
jgi:DNA-binding MarR family transcriptional regulator